MNVYDPYVHRERPIDEATALRFAGDYVPVKSLRADKWFVVHFRTNRSFKLSELPEDADGKMIESMISAHELSSLLLEACYEARFRMVEVAPPSKAELEEAKAWIDSRYGSPPRAAAEARALFSGYKPDEVRLATVRLSEKLLDETVESTERVRISALAEEG
jgi:hypothetical protein